MSDNNSTEKTKRTMTARGFIKKALGIKLTADGFLNAHKEWLLTGQIAQFTKPFLDKLDSKEMEAEPCLEKITYVVYGFLQAQERAKTERFLMNGPLGSKAEPKPYFVQIFDGEGNIATKKNDKNEDVDLICSFTDLARANNWCDLRLFNDCAPECYGIVQHLRIQNRDGDVMATRVSRDEALARILKEKRGPVTHAKPQSSSLKWQAKVAQSRSHFSHG